MLGRKNNSTSVTDLDEDQLNARINALKHKAEQLRQSEDQNQQQKLSRCYQSLSECYLVLADKEVFPLLEENYRKKAKLWNRAAQQEDAFQNSELADDLRENGSELQTDKDGADGSSGPYFDWEEPDVYLSDMGGNKELKRRLHELAIEPVEEKELHQRYGIPIPNGIRLTGPPGTGKTLTAKALAGELGRKFLSVSGAELRESLAGQSESNVKRLFEQAKNNQPCIIFIDEIDGLIRKREGASNGGLDQIISQFLRDMPSLTDEDVLVIATTNRDDIIDDAAKRPERFGEKFEIGLPDLATRQEILQKLLEERPVAPSDVDLRDIARKSEDYSGADLRKLVIEAARAAKNELTQIQQRHLEHGLAVTEPSVEDPDEWT